MRKTTLFAVATAAMIAVGFGAWAIGAPSGLMGGGGSLTSRASLIALPSNARVLSTDQGIDPHQMMMNASAMPTTEFVDYSFVFVH
jgi:hypothetical protein